MMTTTSAPANRIKTHLSPERDTTAGEPLATFLGVFGIGLGLAEVIVPRELGDRIGVRRPALLRAYGLREIAAGLGILSNERPAGWLWGRVAGDVMDLATLGAAYAEATGEDRRKVLQAVAAVAGVTVLDVLCAQEHSRRSR